MCVIAWCVAVRESGTTLASRTRTVAVLRQIVRRRLGPEVAFRKKQGFTVPAERWYAERWSGMLDRLREGTLLENQQ